MNEKGWWREGRLNTIRCVEVKLGAWRKEQVALAFLGLLPGSLCSAGHALLKLSPSTPGTLCTPFLLYSILFHCTCHQCIILMSWCTSVQMYIILMIVQHTDDVYHTDDSTSYWCTIYFIYFVYWLCRQWYSLLFVSSTRMKAAELSFSVPPLCK